AAAQIATRHLARARLHIDIAAGAVQIQRERIFEGAARVIAEELGLFADVGLPAEKRLFQVPALLVHLAVDLRAQLFANRAVEALLRVGIPGVSDHRRERVVELVVDVGDLDLLYAKRHDREISRLRSGTADLTGFDRPVEGDPVTLAVAFFQIRSK